jgi:hypothetical protein
MLEHLPVRTFFRFEFPLIYLSKQPRNDGHLTGWPDEALLPSLIDLEPEDAAIADVYGGWNEDGLYFAFDVPNRPAPVQCDVKQWWKMDGIRICIDTRDTRNNKRATRFCHFLYALPTGGGTDGTAPIVGQHRMSRSKEPPPAMAMDQVRVASHVLKRRYTLELSIGAGALAGWEPAEHPRIGFFYKIKDTQLGAQHLTATDELGWNVDPSTWATVVLTQK